MHKLRGQSGDRMRKVSSYTAQGTHKMFKVVKNVLKMILKCLKSDLKVIKSESHLRPTTDQTLPAWSNRPNKAVKFERALKESVKSPCTKNLPSRFRMVCELHYSKTAFEFSKKALMHAVTLTNLNAVLLALGG